MVIEKGVRDGQFRMVDPHIAAVSLIGMCNWSAWWYKPDGRLSRAEVAAIMADMAVRSLLRDEARRTRSPDVSESLRLLREDLAYLEKLVLPDGDGSGLSRGWRGAMAREAPGRFRAMGRARPCRAGHLILDSSECHCGSVSTDAALRSRTCRVIKLRDLFGRIPFARSLASYFV